MAKVSEKYEPTFILNPTLDEETTTGLIAKFKSLIEQNATLEKVDEWGKRRLAYLICDLNEGFYVHITFESKPDFIAELERVYKITDGVMRSLTVCQPQ